MLTLIQVSALEVERQLLELPNVIEAVVVAVPDDAWGSVIGAMLRLTHSSDAAKAAVLAKIQDKSVFATGAVLHHVTSGVRG